MRFVIIPIVIIISCGMPPKQKALSILKEGLEDPSPKVQIAAAGTLAKLNNNEAYRKLIEFLNSDDSDIAAMAMNEIAETPDTSNARLLRPLLKHESPFLRRLAIEAFTKIGVVEPQIVKMLNSKSVPIVVASSEYVGRMRIKTAKKRLKKLSRKREPEVRIAANIALARMGNKQALNLIKREMSDPNPIIWEQAIAGLGAAGDTTSIEFLEEIVDEGIWPLDITAAEALIRMCVRKDDILISALKNKDPMVRIRAISIISEVGDEKFLNAVLPLTEDPFLNIALQAIKFVSRYKKPEVEEKLISLLDAKNSYVRIAAAEAYLLMNQ